MSPISSCDFCNIRDHLSSTYAKIQMGEGAIFLIFCVHLLLSGAFSLAHDVCTREGGRRISKFLGSI